MRATGAMRNVANLFRKHKKHYALNGHTHTMLVSGGDRQDNGSAAAQCRKHEIVYTSRIVTIIRFAMAVVFYLNGE